MEHEGTQREPTQLEWTEGSVPSPRAEPRDPRIPWELNSFSSRWEKPSLPVSTKHSWSPSLSHHPPVGLDGHSGPGQTLFSAEHPPSHNFNRIIGLFHQPEFPGFL